MSAPSLSALWRVALVASLSLLFGGLAWFAQIPPEFSGGAYASTLTFLLLFDVLVLEPSKKAKLKHLNRRPDVAVFFATTTGNSQTLGESLAVKLGVRCVDLSQVNEIQDLQDHHQVKLGFFIIPTWENGRVPESAESLCSDLELTQGDFRLHNKGKLNDFKFMVLGVGDSNYPTGLYNAGGRRLHDLLSEHALALDDLNEMDVSKSQMETSFFKFQSKCLRAMDGQEVCKRRQVVEEDDALNEEDLINEHFLEDVEDLGLGIADSKKPQDMVTPAQRRKLTKEGYKLIGSHSAVKLCRWTKSQLRGRGGCYKHTFYDIASYQCMEATPSLACANKCVFCWRHSTNPVGTSWRWKTDEPELIVAQAIEKHVRMIKTLKGVPGVVAERFEQAQTVRHCALSLVGEPIMYPRIAELLKILHSKRISTFLVTNAQFPDSISKLPPVTQLYVSVDAPNRTSLKAVDRPLFKDYWDRFLDSLRALKLKKQRTVYRLTLVKQWNTVDPEESALQETELREWADLLELGEPSLIEIKGVTFCGKSDASDLTMKNVPWHHEVVSFGNALSEIAPEYELVCEHEHSCCVLLARRDLFFKNDKWHTFIDFEEFHRLEDVRLRTGQTYTAEDYTKETPDWALVGSNERGFDPKETRHFRNKQGGAVQEYKDRQQKS